MKFFIYLNISLWHHVIYPKMTLMQTSTYKIIFKLHANNNFIHSINVTCWKCVILIRSAWHSFHFLCWFVPLQNIGLVCKLYVHVVTPLVPPVHLNYVLSICCWFIHPVYSSVFLYNVINHIMKCVTFGFSIFELFNMISRCSWGGKNFHSMPQDLKSSALLSSSKHPHCKE